MMPSSSSSAIPHPPSLPSALSSPATSSGSSSSSSPCAACKFLRRKCQPDCVFAPYFPPDNPQKFVHVHRVFGASNVTKILNELPTCHREDAVNSLAYEADMRLKDPVYGCVGVISILQHQLRQLQFDLTLAKAELAKYQNHPAVMAIGAAAAAANSNAAVHAGFGFGGGREGHVMMGMGRDLNGAATQSYYQQQQQQQQHMMMATARNYEADMAAAAARMGANGGGGYDAGMAAAVNGGAMAVNVGMLGGHFLKTSVNGGASDERPSIGP